MLPLPLLHFKTDLGKPQVDYGLSPPPLSHLGVRALRARLGGDSLTLRGNDLAVVVSVQIELLLDYLILLYDNVALCLLDFLVV